MRFTVHLSAPALFFILLTCSCIISSSGSSSSQAVQRSPVVVKRGREVFLRPDDFVFDLDTPSEYCKVRVVTDDPITLRVGRMEPLDFSCAFAENSVRYMNNGNPLLDGDDVRLAVTRMRGASAITEMVTISVNIVDAPHSILVDDPRMRTLEVTEQLGVSNVIDVSNIRLQYNYYNGASCYVRYSTSDSDMPVAGSLIDRHGSEVHFMTHDCREWLMSGMRYVHSVPGSPDTDYLPLEIEVEDMEVGSGIVTERFYLPVEIRDSQRNSPPSISIATDARLAVEQYRQLKLDSSIISASDDETTRDLLVFNITRQPASGFFVNTNNPSQPLRSFKQRDLIYEKIAFLAGHEPLSESQTVNIELIVLDSHFEPSEPAAIQITVVPTDSNGPKVALNRGLVVFEGHQSALTTDNFLVYDRNNLRQVLFQLRGGPRHGRLELDGLPVDTFNSQDLVSGNVMYRHNGNEASEDKLILRVTDGSSTVRVKVTVTILPEDDAAPYLVINTGLEVVEGGYVQITNEHLAAHDKDSTDENIQYLIKTPPRVGEIIKKHHPLVAGWAVSSFSQLDLDRRHIYYRHLGGEDVTDSFEVRVADTNEPPNKSSRYTVNIRITESQNVPPMQMSGTTHHIEASETNLVIITKDQLWYEDLQHPMESLVYTITSQPYYVSTPVTIDAGKIVNVRNMTSLLKDRDIPPVYTFTQADIDKHFIAYMPPLEDIGPIRRQARFVFAVSDEAGSNVIEQIFDVTILPVDNLFPHMTVRSLSTGEGGVVRITSEYISSYDPDTELERLVYTVEEAPRFGQLLRDDARLIEGERFTQAQLSSSNIRYVHDGSETMADTFALSISDGQHKLTKIIPVNIQLPLDQRQDHVDEPAISIRLPEGSARVLTGANIGFLQHSPQDMSRVFSVIISPTEGEVQNDGVKVDDFTMRDLWSSRISYVHTGGETGVDEVIDSMTLMLAGQVLPPPPGTKPLIDLNITITPVDNEPPLIEAGSPMFVYQGQRSPITSEILSVQDIDTHPDDIKFIISQSPQWGRIRYATRGRAQGHIVTNFTMADIRDEVILYVQGRQNNTEPITDRFSVYATDTTQNSTRYEIEVSIIPDNMKLPTVGIQDIQVTAGENAEFSVRVLDDRGLDGNALAQLSVSVGREPEHGQLIMQRNSIEGTGKLEELPLSAVTLSDLVNIHLLYQHDGSDSEEDTFTIRLSDGFNVNHNRVTVAIRPVNEHPPQVETNAIIRVMYGASRIIDNTCLKGKDDENGPDELYFVIITEPRKGIVQRLNGSTWAHLNAMSNFTQADVNNNLIRYLHTKGLSEFTLDDFVFELTDGMHTTERDTFILDIGLLEGQQIAVLNKGMSTEQQGQVVLTTDMLSAFDSSNIPQDLVFVVTTSPRYGSLSIVTNKHQTVSSFSQADILAERIVYTHNGPSREYQDSFNFTVVNGLNHSMSGEFQIKIDVSDRFLPSLNVNVPLTVVQGERVLITAQNLLVSDRDTDTEHVEYVLMEPPQHGSLLKRGEAVRERFSQKDVDDGVMEYDSDSSGDGGMDFFLFAVSDGHNQGFLINGTFDSRPAFFNILIQPATQNPPTIVRNRIPERLENFGNGKNGFVITREFLQAEHPSSESSGIQYTIRRRPRYGVLESLETERPVNRKFSQEDVDDGRIVYILEEPHAAVNDSFTFRVSEPNRNSLDDQTFTFQWSLISFKQTQYIVCEDASNLPVVLNRQGALNSSVSVQVRSKQMSAKEGLDYMPSPVSDIVFLPGQTTAVWNLEIFQDVVRDDKEKFKILLRNPVNAFVHENDKIVVQIIDFENGRCPEYIGIITRSGPSWASDADASVTRSNTNDNSPDYFGDRENTAVRNPDGRLLISDPSYYYGPDSDEYPIENDEDEREGAGHQHRNGRKNKRKKRRRHNESNDNVSTTTPAPTAAPAVVVPRPCTWETRNMLYRDRLTSRMYLCSGHTWQPWTYGESYSMPAPDDDDDDDDGSYEDRRRSRKKCPSGWSRYRTTCHKAMSEKESWSRAEHRCEQMGAKLTDVASSKHLDFLLEMAEEKSFWIGLNSRGRGDVWEWTNRAPARYYNWRHGFPKQRGAFPKQCVLVSRRGEWVNRPCDTVTARYICAQARRSHRKRSPR